MPGEEAGVPMSVDLEADRREWFSLVLRPPESVTAARAVVAVQATDAAGGAVVKENLGRIYPESSRD